VTRYEEYLGSWGMLQYYPKKKDLGGKKVKKLWWIPVIGWVIEITRLIVDAVKEKKEQRDE
jgi:hypothetical protein